MAVVMGLHFEQTSQTGVVFHMISALPDRGRVGITAIGPHPGPARRSSTTPPNEPCSRRPGRPRPLRRCLPERPSGREGLRVEQGLDDGLPPGALLGARAARRPAASALPHPAALDAVHARVVVRGVSVVLVGSMGSHRRPPPGGCRSGSPLTTHDRPGGLRVCHRRAARCVPPVTQAPRRAALAGWTGRCSGGCRMPTRGSSSPRPTGGGSPAGEVVFHEADPADTVHLVVEGRFAARRSTPAGDTVTFSILGPGDTFGELALLGSQSRRTSTVVALRARGHAEPWVRRGRAAPGGPPDRRAAARHDARPAGVAALRPPARGAARPRRRAHRPAAARDLRPLRRGGERPHVVIPLTQDAVGDLRGHPDRRRTGCCAGSAATASLPCTRGSIEVLDRAGACRRVRLTERGGPVAA